MRVNYVSPFGVQQNQNHPGFAAKTRKPAGAAPSYGEDDLYGLWLKCRDGFYGEGTDPYNNGRQKLQAFFTSNYANHRFNDQGIPISTQENPRKPVGKPLLAVLLHDDSWAEGAIEKAKFIDSLNPSKIDFTMKIPTKDGKFKTLFDVPNRPETVLALYRLFCKQSEKRCREDLNRLMFNRSREGYPTATFSIDGDVSADLLKAIKAAVSRQKREPKDFDDQFETLSLNFHNLNLEGGDLVYGIHADGIDGTTLEGERLSRARNRFLYRPAAVSPHKLVMMGLIQVLGDHLGRQAGAVDGPFITSKAFQPTLRLIKQNSHYPEAFRAIERFIDTYDYLNPKGLSQLKSLVDKIKPRSSGNW